MTTAHDPCSAGCEHHRILQILPGTPGWSLAVWHGDWKTCCSLEREKSRILVHPVMLWVLVEHDGNEHTIEPWDARGLQWSEFDSWTTGLEYLQCNINYQPTNGHCDMRVFGPTDEVRAQIDRLTEDDCLQTRTP